MDWKEEFKVAAKILIQGGVILYPTDTIWGIGADMNQENAINKVYNLKKNSRSSPFIFLASSIEMVKCYVRDIPPRIEDLISFNEKPLTVIYNQVKNVPSYLLGKDNTLAIRVTKEYYSKGIADAMGRLITATSANVVNTPYPKGFGDIQSSIIEKVDFISTYKREVMTDHLPSVMISYNEHGELDFVRS